jgi:hypothetical protein
MRGGEVNPHRWLERKTGHWCWVDTTLVSLMVVTAGMGLGLVLVWFGVV